MDFPSLLCKASALLLVSCGSVFGTNFPPAKSIPFPPQQNIPLDFGPDVVRSETPLSSFQPAERLPDSFIVTESATEKFAGDQIPNEATLPKVVAEEWSSPSGTIGPVATPRPDDSDAPSPFIPEKEKPQFLVPVSKPDDAKKQLPPSVLVFSRGVTGHYAEQGWIPFDSTASRKLPISQGESSNQNIPGNLPIFPTPVRPNLLVQPNVWSQWIPPPVPQRTIPRSVPANVPVVIIQNVSVPFPLQPPQTFINAPLPSDTKPTFFQPLPFFPKPIAFPAPKTFIFPGSRATEAPVTNPPVDETPAPPEVTTVPPTTTPALPPPPSPPPPPPPQPPPAYFIMPPKKEIISIFPQLFVPPTPMKFSPPQNVRPVYYTKTGPDDSQFLKTFSPPQYNVPSFPPTINSWDSGPNILKSQFIPQNVRYPEVQGYDNQKRLTDGSLSNTVTGIQTIPPLSSDLWIIKGPANPPLKANASPVPIPIGLLPKPKIVMPVRGNAFSPILDQDAVPFFPGIPTVYPIYPAPVNSSSFYRFPRTMPLSLPLLRLYMAPQKQSSSSPFPTYNSEASSQLDNFPIPYMYPVMPSPFISQPRQQEQENSANRNENCSTPASQDVVVQPRANFYVQPSAPVYLPLPQDSYSFIPVRSSIPDVPAVVFRPLPTADSRSSPVIELPAVQEPEREKREDQRLVIVDEQPPSPPEVSAAENVVISPIFPFINPPVSFPKPVATSDRPPYFFRYGQSDSQGPLQYRTEEATSDGIIKGSYSFRGADGILRKVDYTADSGGYRVAAPASELNQQRSDPVPKDNEKPFAGSSREKNTAESEP